jgi:hypothetical protein
MLGDAVSFLLVRIVRRADAKLCLNNARTHQTLHALVAKGLVQ